MFSYSQPVSLIRRISSDGDLNPNNVLLKNDTKSSRGYVCKLAVSCCTIQLTYSCNLVPTALLIDECLNHPLTLIDWCMQDFGLSVRMQAGQSHISNMRRGTPFYTAPEVMSKGNMTKAADTFSYGVMLWEMVRYCPALSCLMFSFSFIKLPSMTVTHVRTSALCVQLHSMMCYKTNPDKTFEARNIFPSFPRQSPARYAALSTACMSPDPAKRPTMEEIVQTVKGMYMALKSSAEKAEPL